MTEGAAAPTAQPGTRRVADAPVTPVGGDRAPVASTPVPPVGLSDGPVPRRRSSGSRLARRQRWLRRANDAEAWLSDHQPDRGMRWLIVGAGIVAVVLISVLDRTTTVSLALLSVIPILAVTLTVSAGAGIVLVVASAVSSVLADVVASSSRGLAMPITDGAVRLVCFALAVGLVAGLRSAFADSRRSDQRSRDFLGFVAHQLRTPVSGIRTNAEALILAGEPPEREHLLSNLAAESARIGRLMTSLLQLSRLDQGALFAREPVDVTDICESEADRARHRVGDRITVVVDTSRAPAGPVDLSFDATRESLANLVDNATRFAVSRLDITLRTDDGGLVILVADDGPGLQAGHEEQVFERFVTLDQRGVGLGLSIARGLCEIQRGTLEYLDGRFVMWLPTTRSRRV